MMTKSLCCVSSKVRSLTYYDGLTDVDKFIDAFEREVMEKHHFQVLDLTLRATLARWWGTHKDNFDGWHTYRRLMKVWFGHPMVRLIDKYDGRSDPREHFAKWTDAYGAEPQPEWVHQFYHTLDVIPMNWYLETELRHGIDEWDILKQEFLMTFSFEDGFECIDEALQEVKAMIFRILHDPFDLIQPDWTTQLCHALECYNVTPGEEEKDLRNITILETDRES